MTLGLRHMEIDERILEAVRETEIIRLPRQKLATFGTTNIYYYILTEPAYREIIDGISETVIREGRVIAERPRVVTPYYLMRLEGFGNDARRYFEMLIQTYGSDTPGIFYTYKNEPKQMNIVSDNLISVAEKLKTEIEQKGDPLVSIIKGKDELWDVSLMKFIFEITRDSLSNNVAQLGSRGLLRVDPRGIPAEARIRIENMFYLVETGELEPRHLKDELDRWGIFDEYEDRFLRIFKK